MSNFWIRTVVATLVLTVLQIVLSFLVPASARGGGVGLPALMADNALIALVTVWLAGAFHGGALRRALLLWLVWGGIQAASLFETVLFDIGIPRGDLVWLGLHMLAVSAGYCASIAFAFPPAARSSQAAPMPTPGLWRWAAGDLLYVFLYFGAGMLVWPFVQEFYQARPMPPVQLVLAVQLVRALALVAIVFAIVRELWPRRGAAALAAGVAMGVLGGVAPLLLPNPYLPDAVRLAHLPETAISNLVFGMLAAWLLAGSGRTQGVPAHPPSPAAVS